MRTCDGGVCRSWILLQQTSSLLNWMTGHWKYGMLEKRLGIVRV